MTLLGRSICPVAFSMIDLFSGGGGMSYGFHAHPSFVLAGAADAQIGKPSSPRGSLACNDTYLLNMGFAPTEVDLATIDPADLRSALGFEGRLDVLSACPPCTGFSRAMPSNHLIDDGRNSLVTRTALFAEEFQPRVLIMENARELLTGNFRHHFDNLTLGLEKLGYTVHADSHMLSRFGLPQIRERALVVATAPDVTPHTLDELWSGFGVDPEATSVRRAISHLAPLHAGDVDPRDGMHASPNFSTERVTARIRAIPHDGGSWRDIWDKPELRRLLTPSMLRSAEKGRFGSYPDVYGRMWWDKPAPTIKRECGHIGNGRYAHPEQDRLLSLREIALLNGFPDTYNFGGGALANRYRHVGDAVPPLISHQLAWLCHWILTDEKPALSDIVLPGTSLTADDILGMSVASHEVAA